MNAVAIQVLPSGTTDGLFQFQHTVLLVGEATPERRRLAEALAGTSKTVFVRTASSLPLRADDDRPCIDAIVLLVSMVSQPSLDAVRALLPHISAEYLVGRILFAVTNAHAPKAFAFDREVVTELAACWRAPTIFGNTDDDDLAQDLAARIRGVTKSPSDTFLLSVLL